MKGHFKFLKSLSVVLILAIAVTGCTGGPTSGSTSSGGKVSLQWWGVFWDSKVVQSLIDEYQAANKNVEIKYVNKWAGGDHTVAEKLYQDEVDRVLKNNNQVEIPDIFMTQNTWAGNYEKYVKSAPSSVIDANTVKSAYYAAVAKDFARGDVVRGLPLWMDTLAVVYNKDILSSAAVTAPPTNWPDFKNLAISLTQRSGSQITRAGFAAGTSKNVSFGFELLNLLMLQNGVSMISSTGSPTFSTDNDSVTALSFYQSFAGSGGSWNSSMSNDSVAFLEGKLAMMVVPSWRYYDLLKFNKLYDLGINIGVAPLPQLEGQNPPTINWATYWGNMVSLSRPNSDEAWKFVKWLSEPAQLRKLRTNEAVDREFFGFLYPRVDMQQDLQRDTYLKVYNAALPTADSWYMVDGLAVKSAFNTMIDTGASASSIATAENQVQTIINNKGQL